MKEAVHHDDNGADRGHNNVVEENHIEEPRLQYAIVMRALQVHVHENGVQRYVNGPLNNFGEDLPVWPDQSAQETS